MKAEIGTDHQHGRYVRVTIGDGIGFVRSTTVAVYIDHETGVVTTPQGQYGIEVSGPWHQFREAGIALAQSDPGPDIETIRDAICLLEQSAGPFDEACRILRAADPEQSEQGRASEDTKRLDKLERLGDPGVPWIARQSTQGRGFRLHQSWSHAAVQPTVREAIDAAPQPQDTNNEQ